MKNYLEKVRDLLCCNTTEGIYTTYAYTNNQINDNLDYFKKCEDNGLSPYKSLLFFGDYEL